MESNSFKDAWKRLTRRRKRILGVCASVALLLVPCWFATGIWGVPQVCERFRMSSTEQVGFRHPKDPGEFTQLSYDPSNYQESEPPTPWSYASGTAIFPFIISIEHGWRTGPTSGAGYRVYVLWFFGWQHPLYGRIVWIS